MQGQDAGFATTTWGLHLHIYLYTCTYYITNLNGCITGGRVIAICWDENNCATDR